MAGKLDPWWSGLLCIFQGLFNQLVDCHSQQGHSYPLVLSERKASLGAITFCDRDQPASCMSPQNLVLSLAHATEVCWYKNNNHGIWSVYNVPASCHVSLTPSVLPMCLERASSVSHHRHHTLQAGCLIWSQCMPSLMSEVWK